MSYSARKRSVTEDYVMCARLRTTHVSARRAAAAGIKVVEGTLEPTLAGPSLPVPPFHSMRQCLAEQLKTVGCATTAKCAGF